MSEPTMETLVRCLNRVECYSNSPIPRRQPSDPPNEDEDVRPPTFQVIPSKMVCRSSYRTVY